MDESSPPPAVRRQRDEPAVRRAQILDEAIGIIGERGYFGFALHDLAARCGLTAGGLLYHYGSKEVLFLAVLEEFERRMEVSLRAMLDDLSIDDLNVAELSRATVLRVFRALQEQSVAHPHLIHLDAVLRAEALHHAHPGYDQLRKREVMILDMFALLVRDHATDPQASVRQIYALMMGLEHQWLHSECSFDLLAEWDRAIALILPEKDGA